VFTSGSVMLSPGLGVTDVAPQTTVVRLEGVGAAWHLVKVDAIYWDCEFTLTSVAPETYAFGAGTVSGGCVGTPFTDPDLVSITCPVLVLGYARVGPMLQFGGLCYAVWGGIGFFSDVTLTVVLKPAGDATSARAFDVVSGAFRYSG